MSGFETTQWSLVLDARDDDDDARAALAELCRRYRAPVLGYLRMTGHGASDAEDVTQAFFVRFIEGRINGADPRRGRFRNYLLGALKHFVADQRAAAHASKRGGGAVAASLDDESSAAASIASTTADPEREFERGFAFAVIDRAVERLRGEAHRAGKAAHFEALAPLLLEARESGAVADAAQRLGVRANTLAVTLSRWRDRIAALIRIELADTVASPDLVDDEMRALRAALRGG